MFAEGFEYGLEFIEVVLLTPQKLISDFDDYQRK